MEERPQTDGSRGSSCAFSAYRWLYLAGGCVVLVTCGGALMHAIVGRRAVLALIFAGIIILWWLAFYCLERGKIAVSLAPPSIVAILLLLQLNKRRLFVLRYGGWELPHGSGSPLAFLLGLLFELLLCIYFLVVTMLGLHILLARSRRPIAGRDD